MSVRRKSGSSTRRWLSIVAAATALVIGCAHERVASPGAVGDGVVRLVVANELLAPITVAIDDTVALILSSGTNSGLAVSTTSQWLTWTSAKAADSIGNAIPDDIGQVKIRVSGIQSTLEITNVIRDTTYVTADLYNETTARVAIGVYDGRTVSCVTVLRGATPGVRGFTKIGYYRLLPATEIRAYRDVQCTGPYVAWKSSQLAAFRPKSGLVSLTLTTRP